MTAYAPITAVLGPTNTGKTHLAVERMLARRSGVIGLPLRLLAREIYDRVVREKGERAAALVTGEEKIVPASARYFVCTAEAMPLDVEAAFVAVDEIQLAADPERGHVFTDRLLHARGTEETMLLGAASMRALVRRLVPQADIISRERFSQLRYAGPAKLTRLPRRSAIVAFSSESVYAIAELIRRQRGGAAVVMGALSPRTRNAQVDLYQAGEVDYLIATDAIGMGLNMDVGHVAFAERTKFDGRRRRRLTAAETGQIAGRAGRFRDDGTFGETADVKPFEDELVKAVENHDFPPVERLQWRNADLDLSSLRTLLDSLAAPPPDPALVRVRDAEDEQALALLASDPAIAGAAARPDGPALLWEVCRTPDFRKITIDAHARLLKTIFRHLAGPHGRLPADFMARHLQQLDRADGDVGQLAQRLAHVRTWAYVANRPDWTERPETWRARAREVEDRLSDALHERLMQRFVDRRTSALVRGLREERDLLAGLSADGAVTVEGHPVGRLEGLAFRTDARGSALAARAVRGAAEKALRPEVNRRLGELARADAADLTIGDDGRIDWRGEAVARLAPGPEPLRPSCVLLGGEIGAAEARERARRRIETLAQTMLKDALAPLFTLSDAAKAGDLPGLARGVAWRLAEAGGVLPREAVADEARALSPAERRALRALGVRIGEYSLHLPALLKPGAARLNALVRASGDGRPFLPAPGLVSLPADDGAGDAALAAAGFLRCGPLAVRADMAERLADLIRAGRTKQGFELTPAMTALLGCSLADLRGALSALGYRRLKRGPDPAKAEGELWGMRRRRTPAAASAPPPADSPFAPLAALRPAKPARARRRRPPTRKARR
ncbi:MAG: ATP-dependent DNA helicase [Maricaulaceae bacterium]|nr:ATP-dependent DNA helicase [Maricaulaceae bacterium]